MADRAKHPLKICMVGDATSIHFLRWTKMFQERGHEIVALSPRIPEAFPAPCHCIEPVHPIPFLRTFQRILKTRSLVARIKPEVVIGIYLVGPGWWSAFAPAPVRVIVALGSDISSLRKRTRYEEFMNARLLRKYDIAVAVSNFMTKCFEKYRIPSDRIVRINNPLVKISPPGKLESDFGLLAKYGLEPGKYFVSLRGMGPVYNQETIIDAIHQVLQEYADYRFVFLKYSVNPEYLRKIEQRIDELSLGKSIRLLDSLPFEQLAVLCKSAVAGITMSLSDSVPMCVVEMHALCVPVIAGDIPPIRDLIEHERTGLLVDVSSSAELAAAMVRLVKEKELRAKFAKNAIEVVKEYDSERYAIAGLEQAIHRRV